MIMAAASFLEEVPSPTEDDVKTGITNLCRCGTYPRIKKAVLRAAAAQAAASISAPAADDG
jgi:isoquinoline 1-oxidoreductase alpha subunit